MYFGIRRSRARSRKERPRGKELRVETELRSNNSGRRCSKGKMGWRFGWFLRLGKLHRGLGPLRWVP